MHSILLNIVDINLYVKYINIYVDSLIHITRISVIFIDFRSDMNEVNLALQHGIAGEVFLFSPEFPLFFIIGVYNATKSVVYCEGTVL